MIVKDFDHNMIFNFLGHKIYRRGYWRLVTRIDTTKLPELTVRFSEPIPRGMLPCFDPCCINLLIEACGGVAHLPTLNKMKVSGAIDAAEYERLLAIWKELR